MGDVILCMTFELRTPWELGLVTARRTSGKLWMMLMSLGGQGALLGRKLVFDFSRSYGLCAGSH